MAASNYTGNWQKVFFNCTTGLLVPGALSLLVVCSAHNGGLYRPVVIRQVGLTTSVPDQDTAKFDGYPKKARTDAEALVAYIVIFGAPADARIDTLIGARLGRIRPRPVRT